MNTLRLMGVLSLFVLAGCTTNATLNTSASAERSYDGLYPFQHTIVDRAWARGDLDLSKYTKLKLEGAGIQYRPTSAAANSRIAALRGRETEFPINEQNRERLRSVVQEAFLEELDKLDGFELTDNVGPDVLLLRGALLDVVSGVPRETSARVDVYLEAVGEATLMLELVDSQTNTVLVRAVDRRAAERQGQPFKSNRVQNWNEVKRLAQFWARLLRQQLNEITSAMTLADDAV